MKYEAGEAVLMLNGERIEAIDIDAFSYRMAKSRPPKNRPEDPFRIEFSAEMKLGKDAYSTFTERILDDIPFGTFDVVSTWTPDGRVQYTETSKGCDVLEARFYYEHGVGIIDLEPADITHSMALVPEFAAWLGRIRRHVNKQWRGVARRRALAAIKEWEALKVAGVAPPKRDSSGGYKL